MFIKIGRNIINSSYIVSAKYTLADTDKLEIRIVGSGKDGGYSTYVLSGNPATAVWQLLCHESTSVGDKAGAEADEAAKISGGFMSF